jgi:hypothetical protein
MLFYYAGLKKVFDKFCNQLCAVPNPMTKIHCSMIRNVLEAAQRSNTWEIRLKQSLDIQPQYSFAQIRSEPRK